MTWRYCTLHFVQRNMQLQPHIQLYLTLRQCFRRPTDWKRLKYSFNDCFPKTDYKFWRADDITIIRCHEAGPALIHGVCSSIVLRSLQSRFPAKLSAVIRLLLVLCLYCRGMAVSEAFQL
ncbi:hypothetical protein MHYP_G00158200 [Metynnis hypsauchen]